MSTFTVSRRAEKGEKPKHLRQKGLIPMAIVDRDHKTHSVKAPLAALQAAVKGADSHGVILFQIEGEEGVRKAMLKSVDGDPLAHTVFSATFKEVNESDMVKTTVPVVAVGGSLADENTELLLRALTTELSIRAKVSDIPEAVEVDTSKLEEGHHISVSDLTLPEGVEVFTSPEAILFNMLHVQAPVLETEDLEVTADGEVQAEGDAGVATPESQELGS